MIEESRYRVVVLTEGVGNGGNKSTWLNQQDHRTLFTFRPSVKSFLDSLSAGPTKEKKSKVE